MLVVEKMSLRQACKWVQLPRSEFQYRRKQKNDDDVITALQVLVDKHPTIGFWHCYSRLRRKGFPYNHKKLYRVYKLPGLNIRRKMKRRLPQRIKDPLFVPEQVNHGWSMDFFK
jgi:putative transposase